MRKNKAKPILLIAQNGKCFYCNQKFSEENIETVDHFIPSSKGGSNNIQNMVLAHTECNNKKSDNMPSGEEIEKWRFLQRKIKTIFNRKIRRRS